MNMCYNWLTGKIWLQEHFDLSEELLSHCLRWLVQRLDSEAPVDLLAASAERS